MHKIGTIWYFLAIFVAETFLPLSEDALGQPDARISPI